MGGEFALFLCETELKEFLIQFFRDLPRFFYAIVNADPYDPRKSQFGKNPYSRQVHFKRRGPGYGRIERPLDAAGELLGDLAQEFQGEMDVVRLDPFDVGIGPAKRALEIGERLLDLVGQFDSNESANG